MFGKFKEAPMILGDGFVRHDDDVDLKKLIATAKRHGLPVQISTWTPSSVASMRDTATSAGVDAVIVGTIAPEKGEKEAVADSNALAQAGVDMLHAHVVGPFEEMQFAARAMAATKLPFSVSALRDGSILGMTLAEAIARLDADAEARPWHYLVACAAPVVAQQTLEATFRAAPALAHRIIGVAGDARDVSASEFASAMSDIAERFGLNLIGGCCGMDAEKFDALATALAKQR